MTASERAIRKFREKYPAEGIQLFVTVKPADLWELYAAADAEARVVGQTYTGAPSAVSRTGIGPYDITWLYGKEPASAGWGVRGGDAPAPSAAPPPVPDGGTA